MNTEFPVTMQEFDPALLTNEIDPIIVKNKLRKALPFIIGAATAVAGTLLIRAWIQHSKNQEIEEVEEPIETPAITAKSIAFQLLPFATLFLKNWITRNKTPKPVVTE